MKETETRIGEVSDTVPASLRWYLSAEGAWDDIKTAILEHDPSCASLPDIWLARTGGVSCPSDLGRCDDCGVMFYNEGLMGQYSPGWKRCDSILQTQRYLDEGDEDEYEAILCECCGRRRRERSSAETGDDDE